MGLTKSRVPSYLEFGLDKVKALTLLAGIRAVGHYKLANDYWRDDAEVARVSPWWMVQTQDGDTITLGWRKRVLEISWAATTLRQVITADDTTKSESMVHAWSYAQAVEYLTRLGGILAMQARTELDPSRPATETAPGVASLMAATADQNEVRSLRSPS